MPFAFAALLVAIAAAAGSLYLTLELGQQACTLCLYPRGFAFALVGVLATGILAFRDRPVRVCLLALPVAVAGLGVAGYTVFLASTDGLRANENWFLACPRGIENHGTAAEQSLAAFGLVTFILLIASLGEVWVSDHGWLPLALGIAIGTGAAYGCIVANPALPAPLPADGQPLTSCRPTLK